MITSLILIWMSLGSIPPAEGTLVLNVTGLEAARGSLFVAVYDKEDNFRKKEKPVEGRIIPVKKTPAMEVSFEGLAYGRYAVAVFHDLNGNGKLDANTLGIPKEPYAFSNNPVVKWAPPDFQEALFDFKNPRLTLGLELKRWKEY